MTADAARATFIVGIDDTDILGARGTNQLARALAAAIAPDYTCHRILRHQLLVDPAIPYTSHNGSASLTFTPRGEQTIDGLWDWIRAGMLADFIDGSDPGLAIAAVVPAPVITFGQRCRHEVVTIADAERLASQCGLRLEALGGTGGGVIGAMAALGLCASGNHGRLVFDAAWPPEPPRDPSLPHGREKGEGRPLAPGRQLTHEELAALGVEDVFNESTGARVTDGVVDVGKKLRPNRRGGRTVLFVEADAANSGRWVALRRD